MLGGDFSKAIIGVRRDISFKMFTEGVISDDTGKVILNLMQQDSVAMRMTMRLAYACVNPVTIMEPGKAITARWPFGAVLGVGTAPPAGGAIDVKTAYPTSTPALAGEAVEFQEGSGWEQDARQGMADADTERELEAPGGTAGLSGQEEPQREEEPAQREDPGQPGQAPRRTRRP